MEQNILFAESRQEWRNWLRSHFETEKEVWLLFPTKASGKNGVTYNDAVEEALCFGWIDGRAGTYDGEGHIRRFTPRRKGSTYSRTNIERLILLDGQGLIHPKVKEAVRELIYAPFEYPEDIMTEIGKDDEVLKNYLSFPEAYRRIRIAYIEAARKQPDEFNRRLHNFITKTRANKMIAGYGGMKR